MSKLYGSLKGNGIEVTRGGTKNSGMRASVQSWNGSLCTFMDLDDDDKPVVEIQIADGSAVFGKTFFRGTLEELKEKLK